MNIEAIIKTAIVLDNLFKKYGAESSDVADAYKQCKPIIEKAISGQITKPKSLRLPLNYFSTEFELFNFRDLYKAAADLNMYLEGWDTEVQLNKNFRKIRANPSNEPKKNT